MPRSFRLPLFGVAVVAVILAGLVLRSVSSTDESSVTVTAVEAPQPSDPAPAIESSRSAMHTAPVRLRGELLPTLVDLREGKPVELSLTMSGGIEVTLRTFKRVQGLKVGGGVALGEVVDAPGTLVQLEYAEDRLTGSVQRPDRHEVWTLELRADATGWVGIDAVHDDLRCALCDADGNVAMIGEGTR